MVTFNEGIQSFDKIAPKIPNHLKNQWRDLIFRKPEYLGRFSLAYEISVKITPKELFFFSKNYSKSPKLFHKIGDIGA